jgi:hypothetical protein
MTTNISTLYMSKKQTILTWAKFYTTLLLSKYTNKLECLSLASLSRFASKAGAYLPKAPFWCTP